ncbi:MAG TPA: F0F1 ATP synthase subunit A [Thermoanaerobaculia bacterium]|jgi:F-type H+-transporting ATPase subunit a|nr:F0F1 ATP synthase subunit A [Thermoanaerobaculia bacterium]
MLIAFLAENPLEHIVRHPMIQRNGFTLLDSHIVMLMLAALLLVLLVPVWVRRRGGTDPVGALVPTGAGNAIEAICEYLRKEIAQPNLQHHTDRFIKFIWSVFFFILTVNLLGLLPIGGIKILGAHIGGTPTANPWITGTMAVITLGMVVVNGLRLGGKQFLAHFSPGPIWLSWLLIPIEVIGLFARIFALIVRLCANMIAGHVLLAVLLSFIFSAAAKGIASGLGVAVPVVLGSVAITLLEIFVALLQAFIFTFLTTLFIGQAVVFHHDHHEGAAAH